MGANMNPMEELAHLLGNKLPPRLPTPPPMAEASVDTSQRNPIDSFGNLQTFDDFLSQQDFPASPAPEYYNRRNGQNSSSTTPQTISQTATYVLQGTQQLDAPNDWELDERMHEVSKIGMTFCPWGAITKFPYKYARKDLSQDLASAFFDREQIYEREWDHYYISSHLSRTGKPTIFVPKHQVQLLLDDMNAAFPTLKWHFTKKNEQEGIFMTFNFSNPNLRPLFLGHTGCKSQFDAYLASIRDTDYPENMPSENDQDLKAFKEMMELAADVARAKSKLKKAAKREQTHTIRQELTKQVIRAQKYMGLKSATEPAASPINVNQPAPFSREQDVIFIAIDVEAWERNHNIITEAGVATLDTRDLQGLPPGERGKDWQELIRARHFRIIENKQYLNKDFVRGCPESFDYGASELVAQANIASILTSCFHEPFSKQGGSTEKNPSDVRQIVLLGHDTETDINYCHQLGFSVTNRGNLLEVMDTAAMYRSYKREPNARNLGGILSDFDFAAWHQHNAGNDAVYTVQAMLAICVADASEDATSAAARHARDAEAKKQQLVEAAMERAQEEADGWDVNLQPPSGAGNGPPSGMLYTSGGAILDV